MKMEVWWHSVKTLTEQMIGTVIHKMSVIMQIIIFLMKMVKQRKCPFWKLLGGCYLWERRSWSSCECCLLVTDWTAGLSPCSEGQNSALHKVTHQPGCQQHVWAPGVLAQKQCRRAKRQLRAVQLFSSVALCVSGSHHHLLASQIFLNHIQNSCSIQSKTVLFEELEVLSQWWQREKDVSESQVSIMLKRCFQDG